METPNQRTPPKWYQVVTIVLEVCQYIDPLQITDIISINRAFATAITKHLPAASWAAVAESSNAHTAVIAPLLRNLVPRYAKVRIFSQSSLRNSYAVQHIVVTDVVGRPLVWLTHCPTAEVTPSILWRITKQALTTNNGHDTRTHITSTSGIPALASIVHREYTAEITSLEPKEVSLMINGKRTSADSNKPLSDMKWMTATGGGGLVPPSQAGLPRGADVWVVVRGYDSMGDVTVTLDSTNLTRGGGSGNDDVNTTVALKARCLMLQEVVEPIDYETARLSLPT